MAEHREESVERDLALTIRAARQERENEVEAGRIRNEDQRFELTRKKVLFVVELALMVAGFVALAFLLITNPALTLVALSGSGGVGGLLLLLRHPPS